MSLEPLRWWHIDTLVGLEALLFCTDSPWTAEMFWAELAAGHHYVVHRNGFGRDSSGRDSSGRNSSGRDNGIEGGIDGYAGLAIHHDEAEVQTIGVHPVAQRTGLGRALLNDLLAAAGGRRVLLEVRTDNVPAIGLYESAGFSRIGLRRNYYQPSGADAFTMHRPGRQQRETG